MTLLRPPTERPVETEAAPSPEALFKEARQRRHRRWAFAIVAAALVASGAWITYGASGSGGHAPNPRATTPSRQDGGPTGPTTRAVSPAVPTATPSLQTIAFFGPTVGYGLFHQTRAGFCELAVAKTTDGGSLFAAPVPVAPCDGFDGYDTGLAFDDHGDGFVYGTSLFVTHDGGTSWQSDPQPGQVVSVEALGQSVWMLEADCAEPVVVTRPERCPLQVYESTDGGRTWAQSASQPTSAAVTVHAGQAGPWLASLVRLSSAAAYVVAAPPTSTSPLAHPTTPGTVPLYFTADGGRSWAQRSIPCGANAQQAGLSSAPSGTLFAVCGWFSQVGGQQHKAALVSTDKGTHWSKRATCGGAPFTVPPCALALGDLGVVDAVSSSTAYEIGSRGQLLETTDGGTQWSSAQVTDGSGGPSDVIFFSPSDGIAFAGSHLWHTANASQSWSQTAPSLHEAPLPTLTGGKLAAATLPAPIQPAASRVQARTSVPFAAPFTLPPSLSATAKVARNRYSVSLYECPHVLRFDAPGIGTGTCGARAQKFGSFGGERQTSARAARAAVRNEAAALLGCPSARGAVRDATTGVHLVPGATRGGSACAAVWKHGRWIVEVVGDLTPQDMTMLTVTEQLAHWRTLPGSSGVLTIKRTAGGIDVLAHWSRGSTVYEVSAQQATQYVTLRATAALSLVSDLTPVSGR